MQETYGKKPVPTRSGGSIPIVALFKKELGMDSILFGFGLDSDGLHSPNEHYGLFNYYRGIETIPLFYKYFTVGPFLFIYAIFFRKIKRIFSSSF